MHAALRRRRGLVASTTALTLASSTLTVLAFTSQGYPATDVHRANDSVWVTSSANSLVGRLNQQVAHLDGAAVTPSTSFDVLQGGGHVLVYDKDTNLVHTLDPAAVKMDGGVAVPPGSQVAMGGGTVTILDPLNGSLWVETTGSLQHFSFVSEKPAAQLEKGAVVAVGVDGVVHAVDVASDVLWTITAGLDGGAATKVPAPVGADLSSDPDAAAVTVVGSSAVVLDRPRGDVLLPAGKKVHVGGDLSRLVLQQPGGTNDRVAVATATSLMLLPLDGSAAKAVFIGGGAGDAAPVWLNGCFHGAWSGNSPALYVRACDGKPVVQEPFTLAADTGGVTFRVNDDVIALNDVANGGVWLADQAMQPVNDWANVQPQDPQQTKSGTGQAGGQAVVTQSKKNRPPKAAPDSLGARPGIATDLQVLANDSDPDGDVLVIDSFTKPSSGHLSVTGNGQALQFTFDPNPTGAVTFQYTISDGNGGTDSASVTVTPRAVGSNSPPIQLAAEPQNIEIGKALRFNALTGWQDPDGDPLFLAGVTSANDKDVVTFTPDGSVSFTAATAPGPHQLTVSVSDGAAPPVDKPVTVVVHAAGAQKPVAHNDYAVTNVGQPVTVHPLANDTDQNDDPLRLASVTGGGTAATVSSDPVGGTVTLSATQPGAYVLTYTIVDEPTGFAAQSTTGHIRIDVQKTGPNQPPVAVSDIAAVRPGQSTDVNVLANDTDPDGDVLVVQSVDVPQDAPVHASVVGHEVVHLTADRALDGPVTLHYVVSDGTHPVTASITVVEASDQPQTPLAVDDQETVRAGDVGSVAVLTNDLDPAGGQLSLTSVTQPVLAPTAVAGSAGYAFVSGDQVRFLAPTQPQQVRLTYTITNATGAQATARVLITVVAVNAATDKAPAPEPVEARVFTGTTVKIVIPLGGVDPDGDSVVLVGATSSPSLGRIVATSSDSLTYEAYSTGGTGTFTYAVRDPYGKVGESTVRVGIASRGGVNQAPLAVDDVLAAKPGRVVSVPVLANDIDPDGDSISLDPAKPLVSIGGMQAKVVADHVVVTVPTVPESYSVQYFVVDSRGAGANGVLSVKSDPNAPTAPPLPKDDYVNYLPNDNAFSVAVDVLKNDTDPDNTVSELTLSIPQQDASLAMVLPNRKVQVLVGAQPRTVLYQVTDPDGNKAQAAIFVPGHGNQPPQPKPNASELRTPQDTPISFKVSDFAFDPERAPLILTESSKVAGTNGTAQGQSDQQTVTFTPAKGYGGPAAVSFEVTDGKTVQDNAGIKATFSVPIFVVAKGDQKPTFQAPLVVVHEGTTVDVNLKDASADADPGDLDKLAYGNLAGAANGLAASIKGQHLLLSVGSPAKAGQVTLRLTVSDGKSDPVAAGLTVQIVAKPATPATQKPGQPKPTTPATQKPSTPPPPLAHAIADQVGPVSLGHPIPISPLSNDVPPPGARIHIVAVSVLSGGGTATQNGKTVVYTPVAVGTAVLSYRIDDSTGLPGRTVDGQIRVVVRGAPAAPGTPSATPVGAGSVALSWTAPAENGAKIDKYGVKTAALVPVLCEMTAATACTVTGLKSGEPASFVILAHNAVGWSQPSPASQPVVPDVLPAQPAPPTVAYGNGSLTVTWVAPLTQGSDISGYSLAISPNPSGAPAVDFLPTITSYVWPGLTNGDNYTFIVTAINKQGRTASPPSAVEHPNDKPAAPDTPKAENTGTYIGEQITVSWAAPADNGDAISGYSIDIYDNGAKAQTVTAAAGATSKVIAAQNGHDYNFTVAAQNRSGLSASSPESAKLTSFGKPARITQIQAQAGDRQASVNVVPPDGNGKPVQRLEVQYNGQIVRGNTTTVIQSLTNGNSYVFQARGCNDTYCGDWSPDSNAVTPHGAPTAPSVGVNHPSPTSVQFYWGTGQNNGCGTSLSYDYSMDGQKTWTNTAAASSATFGNNFQQTYSLTLRVYDP
ncbi:MAG: hypothetical protein QOE76_3382, partial [Frankiales bacterium]|nr:hypothetical protein [Frankiales bacterium]